MRVILPTSLQLTRRPARSVGQGQCRPRCGDAPHPTSPTALGDNVAPARGKSLAGLEGHATDILTL